MPGVPEIEVPTVRPESTPAPTGPEPSSGAYFGKAVGGALSKSGEQLHAIGMMEYQRAAETKAQEAETAYQKQAQQIRDMYKQKLNFDAVGTHTEVSEALEKARTEIGRTLTSKHAVSLYNNSTLKIARFAQEGIDSHFEQQNKSYQFNVFKKGQVADVGDAARYAQEGNLAAVQAMVEKVHNNSYKYQIEHGMDEETARTVAKLDSSKPADAAMKVLSKSGSPLTREAFEKFGELLDPNTRSAISTSMVAHEATTQAQQIVNNAPKMNYSRKGDADPDGPINEVAVQDALSKVPEEKQPAVQKALDQILNERSRRLDAVVKQKVSQIMADGQSEDGTFRLNRQKSAEEIAWMERSAPGGPGNKPGLREIEALERRDDKAKDVEANEASLKRLRAVLVRKLAKDPESIKKMTPDDLQTEMFDPEYPGFNSTGMQKGQALLKSLQSSPRVKMLETIPKHVDKYLEGHYGSGDKNLKAQYHEELISELSEAMGASDEKVKWDDTTINKFITDAFKEKVIGKTMWWNNTKSLIDMRIDARKSSGGKLPVKVQQNKGTGEIRVTYSGID